MTEARPHGIRYAFTLHDVDATRLLGFDNAHGIPQTQAYDHRHRFRKTDELVAYEFSDADTLLSDFFNAVVKWRVRARPKVWRSTLLMRIWNWRTEMKRRSLNELREEMRAVARGERKAPPRPAASLTQALTREALELLEMLIQEHPGTIAEIAERTGRAQPNVSRSLQRLAALGLVRLNRKGREVTPEPIAGSLRIDLATGTYEAQPLKAEAA